MTTGRTVADLAAAHLEYAGRRVDTRRMRPSTLVAIRSLYRAAILPELAAVPLTSLNPDRIERWHARRAKRKPIGANRAAEALRAGWRLAERWGWVDGLASPFRFLVSHRAPEEPRRTVLSPEQVSALRLDLLRLEADASARWQRRLAAQAILLLLETGCRKNEILGLRWAEVKTAPEWRLELEATKTGRRTVWLSDAAIEVLRRVPTAPAEPRPFAHASVRTVWPEIRQTIGAKEATLHDLRRTFSTRLAERGVAPEDVATLLGQRTIRVNVEHYRVLGKERLRDLANQAAAALR